LKLYPYIAVQEGVQPVTLPAVAATMRAGWATESDLDALTALWSARDGNARERLAKRFRAGKRCFALCEGQNVLAATWCDVESISHEPERRSLAEHEVYLFDAFVDPAARGRNLAPHVRYACYEACRALGRTTMLSYTDYFNESSHRFKAKLGSRWLRVCLQVTLFRRWSHTFTLRRYRYGA
jgi:GNAT superfamily N-acetyltransferase